MSFAIAAELQVVLEGVPLPAGKRELLDYAAGQEADARLLGALRGVPEGRYRSLDEVGEAVARVQPGRDEPRPAEPRERGDSVPGGSGYTRSAADAGGAAALGARFSSRGS